MAWGVTCDLEGAGDLLLRRHSYSGHMVELWKIADWLKNDIEQLEVKLGRQPDNPGVPGLYMAKAGESF